MSKTYYYSTNIKWSGVDKDGIPYEYDKVHSVTVICDHNNKSNKKCQSIKLNKYSEKLKGKIIKQLRL